MHDNPAVDFCLGRVNEMLTRQFQAEGPDFSARVTHAASRLPQDLADSLGELRDMHFRLVNESGGDGQLVGDFAFRCGQMFERLEAYRQIQMEMENVVVYTDRVTAMPLQSSQIEPLARFVAVRDRIFRKVADFTLKAILVLLGLLMLGLLLGLV